MNRNSDKQNALPSQYYLYELMVWRMKEKRWTIRETARQAGERFETVRLVLQGKATNKKAYPVARALDLDWALLHQLDLAESEFHRAVLMSSKPSGRPV